MLDFESAKLELKDRLLRRLPTAGHFPTSVKGVGFHRRDFPNEPEQCFSVPRMSKIVQGRKKSVIGGNELVFGEDELLIAGVDLPNTSNILEASPEKPCMAMTIELDQGLIAQLAHEMSINAVYEGELVTPVVVQQIDEEMLDSFLRLEATLDNQVQAKILAPLIIKEIHLRLLSGPNGVLFSSLHTFGTKKNQIARAVSWLRENYKAPLSVEDLADRVHMAPSTFHRHFKEITTLSPLQFQKRLRLHEAQRLMLKEDLDVVKASEAVGYESDTQFSREYKRLFGEPPRKDVTRWREPATA